MLKNYFLGSNTYKGFSGEFSHLLDGRAVILKGGAGCGKSTLMKKVAEIIDLVLKGTKPGLTKDGKPAKGKIELDGSVQAKAEKEVQELLSKHVLYPELDLDFLKKEFVKGL